MGEKHHHVYKNINLINISILTSYSYTMIYTSSSIKITSHLFPTSISRCSYFFIPKYLIFSRSYYYLALPTFSTFMYFWTLQKKYRRSILPKEVLLPRKKPNISDVLMAQESHDSKEITCYSTETIYCTS